MHDKVKSRSRRAIPAVTRILESLGRVDLPRPLIVDLVRRELSRLRAGQEIPEFKLIVDLARASVENFRARRLQPIVNGTGVIVHTNLGRSPLADEAAAAVREIASSYNNLEFDLTTGERGDRGLYIENALAQLCGTQSATIVNNCAAGLVLIVRHFTRARGRARQCQSGPPIGRTRPVASSDPASGSYEPPTRRGAPLKSEVIVSRGELVQIGGGFRIGEILEASGATVCEVGATNKTTLADYSHAVNS
jgi:L-seryl-tRNA(Ser) seleniumtransferase